MPCGKEIYTERSKAVEAINGKNASGRKHNRMPAGTYFCKDCNGWHIYSQGKKKMKKRDETNHELKTHPDNHGKQKEHGVLQIANFSSKKFDRK